MDPMVSARVPATLRDAVNAKLKNAGATPTQLINGAYRDYLESGVLPGSASAIKPGKRKLGARDLAVFKQSVDASSCAIDSSVFSVPDKDLLTAGLRERYEALS